MAVRGLLGIILFVPGLYIHQQSSPFLGNTIMTGSIVLWVTALFKWCPINWFFYRLLRVPDPAGK